MKKVNLYIQLLTLFVVILATSACRKYLDVVPDNIATLENAFTMRSEAEKFLYTCYSYMPRDGNLEQDPAMLGGDEMWAINNAGFPEFNHTMFGIARGLQNLVSPIADDTWNNMYKGLRDCNIFLENISKVPDLEDKERAQWIAEVKFLKAYYHFVLLRMYGPVPLVKVNLPIDASPEAVKVSRDPADSCFAYIVSLLDEAKPGLPPIINNPAKELGRITQPVAYALKAKVLVTAASPLFNGNSDQAGLKNRDGKLLFNSTIQPEKWTVAATACKEAIDICEQSGMKLYNYNPAYQQYKLTDTSRVQLSIRSVITEKWNSEVIWANTQSIADVIQRVATPNVDFRYVDNPRIASELAPPLKVVEMFYTDKGVPVNEDKTWNTTGAITRVSTTAEQLFIRNGYTSGALNFNREPRFYASLGFDGGVWYGQGSYDDSKPNTLYYVSARKGQPNSKVQTDKGSVTGYFVKKLVHFQNTQGATANDYTITSYPWPVIRLAQLYLWYAEALNESGGPDAQVYDYVNKIRTRAGIPTVQQAWGNYAKNAAKFTTKDGMRDIIQQETMIEFAFEGQRFWDLRRWKRALNEFRRAIEGWDIEQSDPVYYYRKKVIFNQLFTVKDYFWPIREENLVVNRNLVQNVGW
ncbi:RagB/SusD family nutrient uptake outer membrane protein [Chitinophaga arvensicola]|uniref:Starch-binding associating with outer membrane n=1 Tax=Chitinophaga arvensicola TaxID=29529 RepID=A0A1I0S7Q3_9BACT|nr:RagB/SusD family nutrient uptake outer membrane protein [Chitinophaga arvensicola]SEW51855.1 Starch-binding associating with outer membrane [Chitinophaga arvensicola]